MSSIPCNCFRLFLSILFSFAAFSILYGQAPEDTTLKGTLDPIEIKAAHSAISSENPPFSLSLISNSSKKLNHSPAVTLDDAVTQLPGIWVSDRENFALGQRITIRGVGWRAAFGVRGIQIVLDEIPLTAADGQSVLGVIDPMFIRRIELIRGPASSFWGNSSGGVLYLATHPPTEDQSGYQFRGMMGSYGLRKSSVQIYQDFGRHELNGYISYFTRDGYRDHSTVQLGRAGFTGRSSIGSNSQLQYFGAFSLKPRAEHPSSLTKAQAAEDPTQANDSFQRLDAGEEVTHGQLGVSFSNSGPLGFLRATLYGTLRDLSNPLPFAIIQLDRLAGGGRVTLQKELSSLSFSFGVESRFQHDDRMEFENDNGERGALDVDQLEKVYNNAVFLTTAFSHNNVQLLGSVRYDRLRFKAESDAVSQTGNRTFQAVSPGVGISYSFPSVEIYSNLNTAFESPTTTELVNRPDGGNGFNPALRPENTLGLELGSRGTIQSADLHFDLAFYRLWITDLLFPFQLDPNGPTFFRNQGETRHQGVEFNIRYTPSPAFEAGLTYNLTHAEFKKAQTLSGESLKGNQIPGIPRHRLNGILHYRPGNVWFTLESRFVDEYPVNNLNSSENDSYYIANARVSYSGLTLGNDNRFTPFLEVNNLTDTRYNDSVVVNAGGGRYFEPAAELNWMAGFSLELH